MILVRIQHHPDRAHLLDRLLPGLNGLAVEVVEDPRPLEMASALRTYRECVTRPTHASHLLVIQDDAIPCRNFEWALRRAISNHPDQLLCLFVAGAPRLGARAVKMADRRGESFVMLDAGDWIPSVALVWPVELAVQFSRFLKRVPEHQWADDPIIGGWARRCHQRVIATVPSLVQHPDDAPSLLDRRPDHKGPAKARAGRNKHRVAAVWRPDWDPIPHWP